MTDHVIGHVTDHVTDHMIGHVIGQVTHLNCCMMPRLRNSSKWLETHFREAQIASHNRKMSSYPNSVCVCEIEQESMVCVCEIEQESMVCV